MEILSMLAQNFNPRAEQWVCSSSQMIDDKAG
jgi:hypothetical protein